jgi:hypothetical protein
MRSLELARIALFALVVMTLLAIVQTVTFGDEAADAEENAKPSAIDETKTISLRSDQAAGTESTSYPPYSKVLEDAKATDGLLKLHQKGTKLYAELASANLNKDYIVLDLDRTGHGRDAADRRHDLEHGRRLALAIPARGRSNPDRSPQRAFQGCQGQPRRESRQIGLYGQRSLQSSHCHQEFVWRLCR